VLLDILLVWIIGIPALAIAGALLLVRRRKRLLREARLMRRRGVGLARPSIAGDARLGARRSTQRPTATRS
jgi:hypothetical protein